MTIFELFLFFAVSGRFRELRKNEQLQLQISSFKISHQTISTPSTYVSLSKIHEKICRHSKYITLPTDRSLVSRKAIKIIPSCSCTQYLPKRAEEKLSVSNLRAGNRSFRKSLECLPPNPPISFH